MQVTETLSEGLKREFKVTLEAAALAKRVDEELNALQGKARINGFRPGKVPVAHLRRLYGRSVMADVVNNAVVDANKAIVEERGLRLAMDPKIDFPESQDEIEKVIEGKGDLTYGVAVEVLPQFEVADFSGLEIVRESAEPPQEEVDEQLQNLAKQNRPYSPKAEGAAAEKDDRVTIDFVGSIDGVEFEGGKGENMPLVIGGGQFIPGFEDGLLGAKKGESRIVKATFPEAYQKADLAGKEASFDVTVKEVEAPGELVIDDELAKAFGMESLDQLKQAIKDNLSRELLVVARAKTKRRLLDALDGQYSFELPPTLVEQEFSNVWGQIEQDMKASGRTFADENTTEDEQKADYRKIAERRVRLGLVLARIGDDAKVQITDDEVSKALVERARQFPGQEKAVWEFYRKNPQALAELRAPIFEEKVIDHILAGAKVTDKTVSRDELLADEESAELGKALKG
ncbi:MAG: trigger factor [Rhizobiales bacterium 65-9]|nr:trigger factor [Hyphomicrobiales bacterium]OJY35627.1 MAG: trigger factor [Rhizobiales bacterium 65-9]